MPSNRTLGILFAGNKNFLSFFADSSALFLNILLLIRSMLLFDKTMASPVGIIKEEIIQ